MALMVLVGVYAALLGGCRNPDAVLGNLPPPPPAGEPRIESISPTAACAGETLTIIGRNFNLNPEENVVTFRENGANPLRLLGRVLNVQATGMAGMDVFTQMTVIVPTAVRDCIVTVDSRVDDEFVTAFGSPDFCGCPTIVGAVAGNGNDGFLVANVAGNITTTTLTLYGYNFQQISQALFIDTGMNTIAATMFTPGVPPMAGFTVPATMDAVTLTIPNNVLVNDCDEATTIFVRLETICASDVGTPLSSGNYPIRVQLSPGAAPGFVPGTVQGLLVPPGVRAGGVDLVFSLLNEPATEQWNCMVEFEFPAGSGNFDPCSLVGVATAGMLSGLTPGSLVQDSTVAGIVGPGQIHNATWDSANDLPGMSGQARIRITPVAAATNTNFTCPAQGVISELIAFDNRTVVGGVGSDSVLVSMETNFQEDLTFNSDFTEANWDVTTGELIGTGSVATTPSPFGTGTVDVVLEDNRVYELFTDIGEIVDVTNIMAPILILGGAINPGAGVSEFHCRTFIWQALANVTISGDEPLIIRCSGTGSTSDVAARFNDDIDLSGGDGGAGTPTAPGLGGIGRQGGGDGGDGGGVTVMGQVVNTLTQPTDGANDGGRAGTSMTFAVANGASSPRPGPGGGGGHAQAGQGGRINMTILNPRSQPGPGGPPRGGATLEILTSGSGGGGGGSCGFRVNGTQPLQPRFGGGGGAGGGSFAAYVNGTTVVNGRIRANGGNGGAGSTSTGGGGGGGGSGGAIGIFSVGGIALADTSLLIARGGSGGGTPGGGFEDYRGGHGSDGYVHLESNGGVSIAGLSDFTGLEPLGGAGVSTGATSDPIDSGSGIDGALDLSSLAMGEYVINTGPQMIVGFPPGQVVGPNGLPVLMAPAASGGGEFELSRLVIPAGYTLRAFGQNPLIIRVSGDATIEGRIDVSGSNGGIPNFAVMPPTAGQGGLGGPGGGDGGDGGVTDGVTLTRAQNGFLPPTIPVELDGTLPPISSTGPTGSPIPVTPALPAIAGESLLATGVAGNGGGGGHTTAGDSGLGVADGQHGAGGSEFGNNAFTTALGTRLLTGGAGGAGGGGSPSSPDGVAANSPGSGGGGAGGYIEVNVGGVFFVAASAEIFARGGDAFRAAQFGGNAGAGAGGSIILRGDGFTTFQAPGPTISVVGGLANQDPTLDPILGGTVTYVPNSQTTGGDGADGRIRIESPIGFNTSPPTVCPASITAADPTIGICPPPTVTSFSSSTARVSEARTRTLNVGGSLLTGGAMFMPAVVTPTPLASGVPTVRVLYRGAMDDFDNPGRLTAFGDWTENPAMVNGFPAIQILFRLFGAPLGGGGTVQPTVREVEIPFQF